jgi:hypothetical protein
VDGVVRRAGGGGDDRSAASRISDLARRDRRRAADEEVTTRADEIVDRGADRLQELSDRTAADDSLKAKLADELADDAAFLRKLKPSLMKARARGDAPTNEKPGEVRAAPRGPQLGKRPKPSGGRSPNPFVVAAAALGVGIVLAKWIDWRGHAHPKR